jgi:hypothetical protein
MAYDAHKEFGGVQLPTRQITTVSGRELFSWSEIDYTFPDSVDAKTFQRP